MRSMLLALALGGGCIGMASCRKAAEHAEPGAAASASPAPSSSGIELPRELFASGRIEVEAAVRRTPRADIRIAGEVISDDRGQAVAGTLVSGRVTSLEAREGETIQKGQVLAWVESPEVGRATAEVIRARARLVVASQKLARQLVLAQGEATSVGAVEEARADERVARADLAAARTLLVGLGGYEPPETKESARGVGSRVAVRSPIAGKLGRVSVTLGALVSPDKPLFRIVAEESVGIIARLPEGLAPTPMPGAELTITPRSYNAERGETSCRATVRGSMGGIDEATRALSLRLVPLGTCAWLIPGGFVEVSLPLHAVDGGGPELVIPKSAVVTIKGASVAFVQHAEAGRFFPRALRLREDVGSEVVVEAGLSEGERVVIKGAILLKGELLRAEFGGE